MWPVSRKSRKPFGPGKPFLVHSVKLVFSYVIKARKIKIAAKFRTLRRLRFEDTKRTMSPEMRPKCFGTLEKRASDSLTYILYPGANDSVVCVIELSQFYALTLVLFITSLVPCLECKT